MIRVLLPFHLTRLANTGRQVEIEITGEPTFEAAITALEARYPMLKGTIRDHITKERRDFIRFFACGEDYSLDPPNTRLPEKVIQGDEPLRIVGAMSGG